MRDLSSTPPFFELSIQDDDWSCQYSQGESRPSHVSLPRSDSPCRHSMRNSFDPADETITWSVGDDSCLIGECSPCIWNFRPGGCPLGSSCDFCHLCPVAAKQLLQHHREKNRRAHRSVKYRRSMSKMTEASPGEEINAPLQDKSSLESGLKIANTQSFSGMAGGTMLLGRHGFLSAVSQGTGRTADRVIGRPVEALSQATDKMNCMMEGVKLSL